MESKQQFSQLDQAQKFFGAHASRKDVAPRATFADELEQKLVEKYITSYQSSHMSEQSFRLPAWGWAFAGVAVTVVAVFAFISFTNFGGQKPTSNTNNTASLPTTIAGEIAYVEGQTEYRTSGNEGWREASAGTTLKAGDSIRTMADARAIINLDDGSALRLNNDSQVTLSQLNPNQIVVANDVGEVYARVAVLDREFTVLAGDMSYQSLGTAYSTYNTDAKKGVKVFHSKVKVDDKSNADFEKVVNEGQEFYKQNKTNKDLEGKVDKLELSEIKKDKFAVWNKEQDEKSGTPSDQLGKLGDLKAPELTVTSPKLEATVTANKITVKGTAEAGALVYVAGKQVATDNGSFSKEVGLAAGLNKIVVKAMDAAGNISSVTLKITYDSGESTGNDNTSGDAGIVITGVAQVSGGIKVSWQVNGGLDTSKGFKIAYNKTGNPSYDVDSATYYDNGAARSGVIYIKDGKTYYIRVCRYTGSGCDNYSNQVTKQAPSPATSAPATISSITLNASGANLSWTTNTGTKGYGFKILYSASSSSLSYGNKIDFTESFAYTANANGYWAICAYYNGTCSAVSNVVEVTGL